MSKNKKDEKVAVLITTDKDKRGVFMGIVEATELNKVDVIAEEVRMAVYWSSTMRGVLGLASIGPDKDCRISYAVKKAKIKGVTAMVELSDEALANWRKEPWG